MNTDALNEPVNYHAMHYLMAELWEIRSEDDRIQTVDLCEMMVIAGGDEPGSPLLPITRRLHDVIASYEQKLTHGSAGHH